MAKFDIYWKIRAQNHRSDCSYHQDQYLFECDCGVSDADDSEQRCNEADAAAEERLLLFGISSRDA